MGIKLIHKDQSIITYIHSIYLIKELIKPLLTGHYRMQPPHHNQGIPHQHQHGGHQKSPKPTSGLYCTVYQLPVIYVIMI